MRLAAEWLCSAGWFCDSGGSRDCESSSGNSRVDCCCESGSCGSESKRGVVVLAAPIEVSGRSWGSDCWESSVLCNRIGALEEIAPSY